MIVQKLLSEKKYLEIDDSWQGSCFLVDVLNGYCPNLKLKMNKFPFEFELSVLHQAKKIVLRKQLLEKSFALQTNSAHKCFQMGCQMTGPISAQKV